MTTAKRKASNGKKICRRVQDSKAFDKKSFRWKKSGHAQVLVACPRGDWKKGRCHSGMRAVEVCTHEKPAPKLTTIKINREGARAQRLRGGGASGVASTPRQGPLVTGWKLTNGVWTRTGPAPAPRMMGSR